MTVVLVFVFPMETTKMEGNLHRVCISGQQVRIWGDDKDLLVLGRGGVVRTPQFALRIWPACSIVGKRLKLLVLGTQITCLWSGERQGTRLKCVRKFMYFGHNIAFHTENRHVLAKSRERQGCLAERFFLTMARNPYWSRVRRS